MNTFDASFASENKGKAIEIRESQLWWLAFLVIILLAFALSVTDAMNRPTAWWSSSQLGFVLNTRWVRIGLILTCLLICAYFRDSARRLRWENLKLIADLAGYGNLLEKKHLEISRQKELSDKLIELVDLKTALDLVLGMAAELAAADTASIMLREKNSDSLRILVSRGLPSRIVQNTEVQVGDGRAGRVAEDGKALILNTDDLTGEMAKRAVRGDKIVSSIIVPIQLNGEIRGVVNVARRQGGACFSEEDLSVLSTLANQASLVIQKIELLENLKEQVQILEATVRELKQAQAELMQSEKLASIGLLAGGVAHEINNPLQVIMGRTELLLTGQHDDVTGQNLKCILGNTNRITGIVSNLLSFSRQSTESQLQEINVNALLEKTLALIEHQMVTDNIVINRDLQALDPILGNPGQLQQVFTNLILNAYQAMLDAPHTGCELTIKTSLQSGMVEVDIKDTGPGISKKHLCHLFEPFFTTKPEGKGTGLGLSIAYGIIQSHGGNIRVQSVEGRGTCFSVSLPVKQDEKEEQHEAP